MGFDFSGRVLEGIRQAPVNSPTADEPGTGVLRDVRPVPAAYDGVPEYPALVDPAADQYRAGIIDPPGVTSNEYLVWAQNTSQITLIDDPSWWSQAGTGFIPTGTLRVEVDPVRAAITGTYYYLDGADRVVVTDDGNRSLGSIIALVVARGDIDYDDDGWKDEDDIDPSHYPPENQPRAGIRPYLTFMIDPLNQKPLSGLVFLTSDQLAALDGGLSRDRGDRVVTVRYTVAPPRFWWTRNDRYETRFGWNDKTQRWEPNKGTAVKDLGILLIDKASFIMDPKIKNLPVGAFLPGDAGVPDSYAMIRLGTDPGVNSRPVAPDSSGISRFTGIMVKMDSEIDDFDFGTDPALSGVVGQTNGRLVFNPDFVLENAGRHVWYSYKGYQKDADGVVGKMLDDKYSSLFLAPLPSPTDYPLIKFGSRSYIDAELFDSDAALDAAGLPSRENLVYISLSTGRLVLSPLDVGKADPENLDLFSKHYLGEDVVYDGVALNQVPQPTKAPVQLVTSSDSYYIPESEYLPSSFSPSDTNNAYRGLGVSGTLQAPDGSGAVPVAGDVGIRPGGDTLTSPATGMIRAIEDGFSDVILFSRKKAIKEIRIILTPEDMPSGFRVRGGRAYVCMTKESGKPGSLVQFSYYDQKLFADEPVYFLQASLTPAIYTTKALIYSRNRDIFRFTGDEVLYVAIDHVFRTWSSSALVTANPDKAFFTADEVAADIEAVFGSGLCGAKNGRIFLHGAEVVEIGYGAGGVKDLSGAAILGFLPGWRAVEGIVNWLPDSGVSVGLFRSPLNIDRMKPTADFNHIGRFREFILQQSIQPNPFQFLDQVPLQDIAGFDENIFFRIWSITTDGEFLQVVYKNLEHYQDIIHRFGQRKFDWIQWNSVLEAIERSVDALLLGAGGVVPESMMGVPGIPGGLYIDDNGKGQVLQDQGDDYILPLNGVPGTATLIERFGSRVQQGARGTFSENSDAFVDDSITSFLEPGHIVKKGYRLKINSGDAQGSYTVEGVINPNTIRVSPLFLSTATQPVVWEIFEGFTKDVYDPMIVADMVYKNFTHLPSETFMVRMLTPLGLVPVPPTSVGDSVGGSVGAGSDRLKANMAGALASGRPISIRYGQEAPTTTNVASLTALTKADLGYIGQNQVYIPPAAINSSRFTYGEFSLQVGTTSFVHGVDLKGVYTFSDDPFDGNGIEYLLADTADQFIGLVKFGSGVLSEFGGSRVFYADDFQDPTHMLALQAEFNPWTGELNFSEEDMQNFGGVKTAYFVEQMITENRKDVSIQPTTGSCSFLQPLPKGVLIEMSYWRADLEGRKVGDEITEFLPVFVRNEIAVREAPNIFTYGGPGRTIRQGIDPIVFVRAAQQNYADVNFVVDHLPDGRGRLTFMTYDITDGVNVKVTYAVNEAQGGEQAYETSQKPVYRPPFYIKANQNRFGLRGDRQSEFKPGQILRIGEECFYIKGTRYYPKEYVMGPPITVPNRPELTQPGEITVSGDITAVYIYPDTIQEVGTRSPARDVLAFITDLPITPVVDPFGDVIGPDGKAHSVSTDARKGLMFDIDLTVFPFEPVNRGQTDVVFTGDLTSFAVPGHIIEIGGVPYTINAVVQTTSGTRTKITLASGVRRAYSVDIPGIVVRMSYRPIYPPNNRDFLGVGKFVPEEGYELVLYGETNADGQTLPGRTLVPTVDYTLDITNGIIKLLDPLQQPLNAPQSLILSFVRLRSLRPYMKDGILIRPVFASTYLCSLYPSKDNGILGGLLLAQYSYKNPDSFYFRSVPMPSFMVEVTREVIDEITSVQPASGAPQPSEIKYNWQRGRIGLKSERKHLLDKDRVARTFLDFYNTTVNAFEQINETISGGIVGDKDGKFRFYIGRGREYPTPGCEDEISGILIARNVYADVFSANVDTAPAQYVYIQPYDHLVDPADFELGSSEPGVIEGKFPDVDVLQRLMDQQKAIVTNEVDDLVLARFKTWHKWKPTYPFYRFRMRGYWRQMYQNHKYSRIFPTWTKTFLRTNPGIGADIEHGDPGVYTAGRYFGDEFKRTTRSPIGQIQNPVLEDIDNVRTAILSKRRARARIWRYCPFGVAEGAFGMVQVFPPPAPLEPSPAILDPCLIATPLLLRDFPIDPRTGYPNKTRMSSEGGDLPDLISGDPEMAVPGFAVGDQLSWGQPDGSVYDAFSNVTISAGGKTGFGSLYVREVIYGCVILFKDVNGDDVITPDGVLVGTSINSGVPADEFEIVSGDTIMVSPPMGQVAISDPPTAEDMDNLVNSMEIYRQGFDYQLAADGQLLDITRPSRDDPAYFPLKEISGQNPPAPLSCMEGPVEFYFSDQNPLEIPALQGLYQDDAGDYAVPYIRVKNTELDRFANGGSILADVLKEDDRVVPLGIYPDEILGNDGLVSTFPVPTQYTAVQPGDEPAALLTAENAQPKTATPGAYTPGSADLQNFDLLLLEVKDVSPFETLAPAPVPGLTLGPLGIHSVGRVRTRNGTWVLGPNGERPEIDGWGSLIEPPRFITPTSKGTPITYKLTNAIVSVDAGAGIKVYTYPGRNLMILDLNDVVLALNNGTSGLGNLNDIWAASLNNKISIRFISHEDAAINPAFMAGAVPVNQGGVQTITIEIQGPVVTVRNDVAGFPPAAVISTPTTNVVFGILGSDIQTFYLGIPGLTPSYQNYIMIENVNVNLPLPLSNLWDTTAPVPPPPPPDTPHASWFLPYTISVDGGNFWYFSNYGVDFAFDIDTWNTSAAKGRSTTAWIDEDRLTFKESIDLHLAKERGYEHPLPTLLPPPHLSLETQLSIYEVTVGHTAAQALWSTIDTFCNGDDGAGGPVPFTFLKRGLDLGTWDLSTDTGSVTVMGFEGYEGTVGNIPIIGDLATFSGIPSNNRLWTHDAVSGVPVCIPICSGWGKTDSQFDADIAPPPDPPDLYDNRIVEVTVTEPPPPPLINLPITNPPAAVPAYDPIGSIEPGDILVIKNSHHPTAKATTKAGTYLIKHTIRETNVGGFRWDSMPTTTMGAESGWCKAEFPKVVSFDPSTQILTISSPSFTPPLPTGFLPPGWSAGWSYGFPDPSGGPPYPYIYIIRNLADLAILDPGTGPTSPEYLKALDACKKSVIRFPYSAMTVTLTDRAKFTIWVGAGTYADGTTIAVADVPALLNGEFQVSGMQLFPVNISGKEYGLPLNNCVGFHDFSIRSVYGFRRLTFANSLPDTTPIPYEGEDGAGVPVPGVPIIRVTPPAPPWPTDNWLFPVVRDPVDNFTFQPYSAPVYHHVVDSFIMHLSDAKWKELNCPTLGGMYLISSLLPFPWQVNCLLPSTKITFSDLAGFQPGHFARSGIYLEPSFPRSALDLIADHSRVVDRSHSLPDPSLALSDWDREIGMRDSASYKGVGAPALIVPSEVEFEVRRIRRFHEVQDVTLELKPLRYAYEIRRGRITQYTWDPTGTHQRGLVDAIDFRMDYDASLPPPPSTGRRKTADVWNDGKQYTGTNLGDYVNSDMSPNEDVNVQPGDLFRLLDSDDMVLEEIRIERILGSGQLQLAAPGLITRTKAELEADGGMRFEIYLTHPVVPHEQSLEQLLNLISDRELFRTNAVWGGAETDEVGGYVNPVPLSVGAEWDDAANILYDDLNMTGGTPAHTFGGKGVKKGDIVIVDPIGKIPKRISDNMPWTQEKGAKPTGDVGVKGRVGHVGGDPAFSDVYDDGYPAATDDNRGYYRITQVIDSPGPPHLKLTPLTTFTGDLPDDRDVIFDGSDSTRAYAVYPTIHDSKLNPTPPSIGGVSRERQMDLRPTRRRDLTTGMFSKYTGEDHPNYFSVRPFSYRIIRPSKLFSPETIDLVLVSRERMLTLIELLGRGFSDKWGPYWVFQADEHAEDLGSTANAEAGLGVLSNDYLLAVLGQTDVSPFLSNEFCMSLLDRRFWIRDFQLDALAPARAADHNPMGMRTAEGGDTPYTAYNDLVGGSLVLPVLPERIEEALEQRDRFRLIRYVWLAYRTHTILGVLPAIKIFDANYVRRRQEQLRMLLKRESLEKLL